MYKVEDGQKKYYFNTYDEAFKKASELANKKSTGYVRFFGNEKNMTLDYGSWSEFIYIKEVPD